MKRKIIFSIDIETSGPLVTKHQIIALGFYACFVDSGEQILKERIVFEGPYEYDTATWETFWSNHSNILEEFSKSIQWKPMYAMEVFSSHLDALDRTYDVLIVSDNASFDFGFVNYYLSKYLDRRPLNYCFGQYRTLCDTDSYNSGFAKMLPGSSDTDIAKVTGKTMPNKDLHNHMPENDAMYIAEFFRQFIKNG